MQGDQWIEQCALLVYETASFLVYYKNGIETDLLMTVSPVNISALPHIAT